jgi:hypothetical protein
MSDRNVTFENVLKWIVIAILAIVALKVVVTVLGIAFFVGGFLFWRVLPLVFVVAAVYMAWQWLRKDSGGADIDPTDAV